MFPTKWLVDCQKHFGEEISAFNTLMGRVGKWVKALRVNLKASNPTKHSVGVMDPTTPRRSGDLRVDN